MKFTKIVKEKFFFGIRNNNLISPGDKILVALSGGPDSVCLYHLLVSLAKKISIEVSAAYIDHGLRPREVKQEIRLVKKLASDLQTPLYIAHLKIPKTKSGPESSARRLRYFALMGIASEKNYGKIATAHNQNDQAETVLLNVIRSTGEEGFSGIPPVRGIKSPNGKKITVIRPLLGTRRSEITGYLAENHLRCSTDTSNYDTRFSRNLLRHKVIPILEKINPAAVSHLSNMAEWADHARKCVDAGTTKILSGISEKRAGGIYLDLQGFLRYNHNSKTRIIRNILRNFYAIPPINQIRSIIKLASERGKTQKIHNPGNLVTIIRKKNHLIFRTKND